MKKYSILIITTLTFGLFSCHNEDWSFPDFEYTTVYFPYQYPIRTLVLGDYHLDNEDDNNLKFLISARVGGMYENHSDWKVDVAIREDLADSLVTDEGDTIHILPQTYYTMTPSDHLIIRKGSFHGGIEIQLDDAFLDDTMAYRVHYVIPVAITGSNSDSILVGSSELTEPNPHIATHWAIRPKNYTLFAIRFVNNYHGVYLRRGQSIISTLEGTEVETINYRREYVEYDELFTLSTSGRNQVSATTILKATAGSPGGYEMNLLFDSQGNCVVSETNSSPFPVTGTGKFIKDGDEWGLKKRSAIHLNYQVNDGTNIHSITDTLVFRDKAVMFELFNPVVLNL